MSFSRCLVGVAFRLFLCFVSPSWLQQAVCRLGVAFQVRLVCSFCCFNLREMYTFLSVSCYPTWLHECDIFAAFAAVPGLSLISYKFFNYTTQPLSHRRHSYVICPAVSTQITEVSGGEWVFVLTSTSNCMNFGCLKKPRFPFWDKHLIKRLFGGLMKTRDMHFFCFFFVTSLHFHLGWK